MLVSWLGIFVMMTSVLGWLPAAAQDATPTDETSGTQATTSDDGTNTLLKQDEGGAPKIVQGLSDDDTDTDQQLEDVFGIVAVSLDCGPDGATVSGSISVTNAQDGDSVELALMAGGTVLRTQVVTLAAAQETTDFAFDLEPSDATAGDAVVVTARVEGSDDTPVSSGDVEIASTVAGDTTCGSVDVPDDTDNATPTATATSIPTNTPTPSPTPSPTPDDQVVEQLVAQLVTILGDVLATPDDDGGDSPTPTPTDPPDSGQDTASKRMMVSGTGGSGLRCRTAPVSGDVIVVLAEGQSVETRGATKDGWVPVRCNGQNGWSSSSYLVPSSGGSGTGELWIDIDLGSQYMRVYRGNTVIGETYVSTGRPGYDTPTGTFHIQTKYRYDDMEGVLYGEYYFVPNVPWTMYFTNRGHAIHGAYWHNNFGHVMSHGCVNEPLGFAEWLYGITPIGTRVVIHY